MRKLALANGIVDLPDARRKAHAKPVAYLGGLAIFLGWLAGLVAFVVVLVGNVPNNTLNQLIGSNLSSVAYIAIGATAIVVTGLIDDVYGIRARVKIGGQLFAAAAIAQTRAVEDVLLRSFHLLDIAPSEFTMQLVGTAMIAVLVVGCCNAMNLIDGVDGLASGVTGIAMAGMLAICLLALARYSGDPRVVSQLGIPMLLAIATISAVAGFLPFNFNPASIFMGDTGSLLLGYLCVTTILFMGRIDNDTGLSPIVFTGAAICFALPMIDTALAIVRRKLNGRPIFAPDAMHIHHMFRRCGLSVKKTALVMYAMGLLFGVMGFVFVFYSLQWKLAFLAFGLTSLLIIVSGCIVSRRLERTETAHPKPAEGPDAPTPPAAPKPHAQAS
jgi:UDP-GlcNAc:undecaprenyl-phosphate GlcNAc-1-phosphate transferase